METGNGSFRLREAFELLEKKENRRLLHKEVALCVYPDSSAECASVKLIQFYKRGKTIDIAMVKRVCKVTGVDPNFLFNINTDECTTENC